MFAIKKKGYIPNMMLYARVYGTNRAPYGRTRGEFVSHEPQARCESLYISLPSFVKQQHEMTIKVVRILEKCTAMANFSSLPFGIELCNYIFSLMMFLDR